MRQSVRQPRQTSICVPAAGSEPQVMTRYVRLPSARPGHRCGPPGTHLPRRLANKPRLSGRHTQTAVPFGSGRPGSRPRRPRPDPQVTVSGQEASDTARRIHEAHRGLCKQCGTGLMAESRRRRGTASDGRSLGEGLWWRRCRPRAVTCLVSLSSGGGRPGELI